MRECGRHSLESQPGGGVCARCVEERLLWLWRGESFRGDDPDGVVEASVVVVGSEEQLSGSGQNLDAGEETAAGGEELSGASVRTQLQVTKVGEVVSVGSNQRDGGGLSGDEVTGCSGTDDHSGVGNSTLRNSKDVMEEWTAFHARRRRNLEGEPVCPKSSVDDAIEPDAITENVRNPQLVILMNAQKMRSRSMPLDNRSAEDTAQRVINEQADDLFFDDLDLYGIAEGVQDRDGGGEELQDAVAAPRCFSPVWQPRKSPKWMKVLVSPMTSRNRVFPSRSKEDARRGRGLRKRGARFASSDWSGKDHGGSSPQWMRSSSPADDAMTSYPRSRSSVFSWLQNADAAHQKKYDQREQLTSSSSSSSSSSLTNSVSTDSWLRDLTTVGHLHEIAEELEIVEESSEEEDDLGDISSFGKFLLLAAQRHPEARLTRLVSANSS